MPKVVCSHCGEELMGTVNRCWRCGQTFVAENNPDNLPPIRRRPIPVELIHKSAAELVAATAAANPPAVAAGRSEPSEALAAAGHSGETSHAVAERESHVPAPPTPLPTAAAVPAATPYYASPVAPRYPLNAGATGGAVASVVLGVMALATIKFVAPGALLISVLGVGMGVWGLYSDRRPMAVLGLLLCCVAMAISGFLSAVQLFELINGYNPFEPDLPVEDPTVM